MLGPGLEKANIDIVGGDSVFFDQLIGSITHGQGRGRLRGALSDAAQTLGSAAT